ncbi:extracellular solute-binding protein [Aurantimonas sp. MSK8Z-1]|uniref:ABC transporter substrate-binding protein n=1 Tax=Mangrovibrevibacter kandeliae TaxID=2968473 RepID=UPI002118B101|nr:extracellular solute-binding protein [Aurantimonas sp. MSK8Z-1]MCW4115451.1 extracellular solute-binding protein [Aurantimonas sp. MSK8Z-1]
MRASAFQSKLAAAAMASGLAAGFHASAAQAASQELVDAAQKEGTVVWYTSMIVDQAVRPLAEAFKAKYPKIDVQFSRASSSDTALKIINEAQAGRVMGDVFDGLGAYTSLRTADLVEPYVADSAAGIPAEFKNPDGYWAAPTVYYLSAAYNTDLVSADEAPKTFEDLLDPQWKGQIVWSIVPQESGAPGFVGNVLMTMGEEKGMDYLKKLSAQGITNMDASQRTVLDRVIVGDFPIALMTYTHHSPISAAKGAPVDWIRMQPVVGSPNTVGLVRNAPHPNAAKLLIDFIESEDGQKVLADGMYLPTNPSVKAKVPELMADGPQPFKVTMMTPEVVTPNLKHWIDVVDQLFR